MGLLGNIAGGVAGAGMGLLLEKHNDQRQLEQEGRLQRQQMGYSKEMAEFNRKQQMRMWEDTNYAAQMAQLKKAGLNPGLIYGMGGSGGATTQAAQAAGPQSGGAPKGGGEAMGMGLQMLNTALMAAQVKNIQADTKKKEAEIPNVEASTASLTQGVENQKAVEALTKVQTRLGEIELEIKGESTKALKYIINAEAEKALQELNILRNEALISENTWSQKIDMVTAQLVGMTLQNELTKSNIQVNEAQIQKWAQELVNAATSLDLDKRNVIVNEKLAEFNTSLAREALGALGGIISTVIGKKLAIKGPKGEKVWESGQNDQGSWSRETYREFIKK